MKILCCPKCCHTPDKCSVLEKVVYICPYCNFKPTKLSFDSDKAKLNWNRIVLKRGKFI